MITPEQLAKSGTEHGHQVAFFQWLVTANIDSKHLMFAVPNGGARSPSVAAAMKAEGVKRGVPDVCWPIARMGYHGLWIELKKPAVKVGSGRSVDQVDWHTELIKQGHFVVVAYSWQAMAWAAHLYETSDLAMPEGGGPLFAGPVDQPPVV